MKKVIFVSLATLFVFAGCTIKKVVKPNSGPSYEQQQKSFNKAYEGM